MRTDSTLDARLALMSPLRTVELPQRQTKRAPVRRFSMLHRRARGQGPIALAELGRETGARC